MTARFGLIALALCFAAPAAAVDKTTTPLPDKTDASCLGMGGKSIFFRIPGKRMLAVYDVAAHKINRTLPLTEEGTLFAATQDRLFLVHPVSNKMEVMLLPSFEKDKAAPDRNPLGGQPRQLVAGFASHGPVYIGGPGVNGKADYGLVSGRTGRPVAYDIDPNSVTHTARSLGLGKYGPFVTRVRISGDGKVIAWWQPDLSPSGFSSAVLGPTRAKIFYEHTTVGAILPGPDGTLFTASGVYTAEQKTMGEADRQYRTRVLIPAVEPPWYLQASADLFKEDIKGVSLKATGDSRPLLPLPELDGLTLGEQRFKFADKVMPLYERLFLVPSAKTLVVVPDDADKVHAYAFDVTEELKQNATRDFLIVASKPPTEVRKATRLIYNLTVLSRKGGVRVTLDQGPKGMQVTDDGKLTWFVPESFREGTQKVSLRVSDASGQEVFHLFELAVKAR
jgi:hypothetical protein